MVGIYKDQQVNKSTTDIDFYMCNYSKVESILTKCDALLESGLLTIRVWVGYIIKLLGVEPLYLIVSRCFSEIAVEFRRRLNMGDSSFAEFVRKKFETLPDLSVQPCIYKVPDHVREVNEECYLPYAMSIGPLYYGRPSLEAMQDSKLRCLKFFLEHENNSYRLDLEHYLTILRELEGSVRDCYAESISLTSDEFNGMILLDSALIICFLMNLHPLISPSEEWFHMYKRNAFLWADNMRRDLFLVENQIPFFILDRLCREAFGVAYPRISFLDLSCNFIVNYVTPHIYGGRDITARTIERIKNEPQVQVVHLVDLLRNFLYSPSTFREQAQGPTISFSDVHLPSSVSKLRDSGVKFVAGKSKKLLDITFSDGVLEIPPFQVSDMSESYFRSMMFYEQCHLLVKGTLPVVDYMAVLSKLIRTPEDVQILVKCGIMNNWTGNDETVVRLFNGLTKHLYMSANFYYFGVCRDLNAYTNTKRHQWKAILKRDYFGHPWAIISVIYALILFLLTLLQTIGTFTAK